MPECFFVNLEYSGMKLLIDPVATLQENPDGVTPPYFSIQNVRSSGN